jgi:capsule polysaccharide export protein KpsE/RkpR
MEDTDKELAAKIANAARKGIDQIAQSLIKESQLEELKIYEADIKTKESQLAVLSDSLIRLRGQYGVYNSIVQTESLTAQFSQAESKLIRSEARLEALESTTGVNRDTIRYLKAAVKGMKQEVEKLNDKVVLFNEGMAIVNIYEEQYKLASETLGEVKELTKELKATYDSNIPAVLLVEEATTPVIKSRPKRSIVVIAAVFVAFLFGIIGILLLEAYRAIDWKELADAK